MPIFERLSAFAELEDVEEEFEEELYNLVEEADTEGLLDRIADRLTDALEGEAGAIVDFETASAEAPPPGWTLHNFKAHRTELQRRHRDQLWEAAKEIARTHDGNLPVRCVRLIGHAATWRGISKGEYARRAHARAQTAADLLSNQLSSFGLGTKIFSESELDPDDVARCRRIAGVDVTLIVGDKADDEPLKPNLTQSNRALNRRVEIFLFAKRKKSKRKSRKNGIPPCEEPGAVCVMRMGDEYEGLDCWWPSKFWDSAQRLDKLVDHGKAKYVCDSRKSARRSR